MKGKLFILASAILALSLTACNTNKPTSDNPSSSEQQSSSSSSSSSEGWEGKTNEELRMLEWEIKEANEPKTEIVKETEAEAKARQEACDRFRARFGGGMMNIKSKKRKRS